MSKTSILILATIIILAIEAYVYYGIKDIISSSSLKRVALAFYIFITLTAIFILLFFIKTPSYSDTKPDPYTKARTFILSGVFIHYLCKLVIVLFLILDDIRRAGKWIIEKTYSLFSKSTPIIESTPDLSRSDFLVKAGLITAAIPLAVTTYGILSGAHDYRVRKKIIYFPNLPSAFDGITVGQLSDIHSGSFFNKRAVQGGVELFLREKPDLILFTGDLVNNYADEVNDYISIFNKVKAPLGVYSTLGNHDYGDYSSWPSVEAKSINLNNLKKAHKLLGWDLLINEHRLIEQEGEKIALLGVENWSALKRFPRYGKLSDAYSGAKDIPFKILLSHDPSHWDAEVRPFYSDIDLTCAGHTHGFQFGIEIGNFKWSPAQYLYKQWAGLYQEKNQYLYVNRGFGYLGYPGRIGILPELTLLTLKKG